MKIISAIILSLFTQSAVSQVINSEPGKMAESYIYQRPKIIDSIKKSYSINSFGRCLAMASSFEVDLIKGHLKFNDESKFLLAAQIISLTIARQEFLNRGIAQEHLDASLKSGYSIFQNKQQQPSIVNECVKIVDNFLGQGK